ncbi:MAG: ABC transporter ATP-binding protein [Lachnospiraceae bacterium]|nr:ABC transporter ATP-binding protein [Lachnospiraceae bacterium]MDD3795265.1 ABC transporter ATP-binding protein [Lachnospiraceae bacterium]
MYENAIELKGICKYFGKVKANDNVSLTVKKGEILSLLGENGSGKTTLMNMLSGIYFPDKGQIFVDGTEVTIRSPKDAYLLGIGMIHQHFKLIDIFTAAENIILGMDGKSAVINMKEVLEDIQKLIDRYGFQLDLNKKVYDMSVSEKQTVEIIKMLYRGANLLILDEPTAVLTPQETEHLFDVLRNMRKDGKGIIIITHKLHEVLAISDRVSILRKGAYIGTVNTGEATENSLTEMMVGEKVSLNIDRPKPKDPKKLLEVKNLTCLNKYGVKALDQVSFTAMGGEILGIAGIAGSGQKELLESIAGLQPGEGSILFTDPESGREEELLGKDPLKIKNMGVSLAFVPEDRLGMGLVGDMGMPGNMMIRSYRDGKPIMLEQKHPRELAEAIKEKLEVVTPSISYPVRRLSGGNVQKVLVGREIANAPKLLMTAYAVRGLDINTSYSIYHLLNEQKEKGVAVIYVGEDLDVLLELSDRIMVMCGGQVSGIVDARTTTKEEVGLLMTKHRGGAGA